MKKTCFGVCLILGIGFFFVFFPEDGEAQSYRTFDYEREQILEQTRWMIGPFRIFPQFRLTNIGYDGNVYYGREGDEPVTDYTATFSPEVTAYLLFRDYFIFSFTENPEYVYYLEEARERRWNHNFSPEFKWLLLSRIVLGGSYSYQNRRHRATSEFDVRANELRKAYRGSVFYETPRQTSFGFNYRKEDISYEDVDYGGEEIYLSRILNRQETTYEGEVYYQVFSSSFFFINGGYTEYEFENVDAQWRDSYSRQFYTGLRFPLLGRINGQISIGYKELIPREEDVTGFSGLVGDSWIDYRMRILRFRAEYRRDSRFSYWTNNVYYVEDRYVGGISFYMTRFLRLDYTYNYGEGHYPEKELVRKPDGTYEELKREDIYTTHTLGFAVRLIENTGIGVNVIWWERDSNVPYADRDRMFIGGYLTYDF
ncbi:MAG: hypothetical protein ACOC5S_05585 [Acidobacteriota bacterium]